jgi:repressor LexA
MRFARLTIGEAQMTPKKRKKLAETIILTPRQLQILRLIKEYRRSYGCSPTLQELAQKLKLSKVTVFEHVQALVQKDVLLRMPNKARSLTINPVFKLPSPARSTQPGPSDTGSPDHGCFPLVGHIAAGIPIEALENTDTLDLNTAFKTNTPVFALKVNGDSMIDEQIRHGDYVLAEKNNQPRDGQIVVALLENGETTLKKYYRHGRRYRLEAANPNYAPIYTDQLNIQGVVIGVIRKY